MRAFRSILCPVDTSEFSAQALVHAVALGKVYDAAMTVVYVRPVIVPPALWFGAPAVLPPEPGDLEATAGSIREFVRHIAGDIPATILVRDGAIVHEILRVADELPADLIVMGTHGASGFERLVLGSVTEKVLRKSPVPVLTVPGRVTGSGMPPEVIFDTIACGVDRSPAARLALRYALSLAERAGGRLVLVHALEDLSQEDPRFAAHFNTPDCLREIAPEVKAEYEALVPEASRAATRLEVRVPQGRAYRELLNVAAEIRAALIVLGAAGSQMPFGSTAQHVLRASSCPVLVVPERTTPSPASSP